MLTKSRFTNSVLELGIIVGWYEYHEVPIKKIKKMTEKIKQRWEKEQKEVTNA